jgi:Luciferase-like monooxygenase
MRRPQKLGYSHLLVGDHVLGANPGANRGVLISSAQEMASRNADFRRAGSTMSAFHDPFVLFGFLTGYTQKIGFTVGVLILAQRQAALVAKQAASLDILCGGRFRLGVGVGWNEIEFIALNENFHNRGRRSEEQVRVMQALWAEPHVTFTGEFHRLEDVGINPRWLRAACRSGSAAMSKPASAVRRNTVSMDAAAARWARAGQAWPEDAAERRRGGRGDPLGVGGDAVSRRGLSQGARPPGASGAGRGGQARAPLDADPPAPGPAGAAQG